MGLRVLHDKLWEIAERADWRLMTVGYKTFAVGAFVIPAVLIWNSIRIWKRMRRIETQLSKIEKKINTLEMHESRRLMTGLNANSKARIDPRDTAVENGRCRHCRVDDVTAYHARAARKCKIGKIAAVNRRYRVENLLRTGHCSKDSRRPTTQRVRKHLQMP
jgi:hypothetical protein